MTQHSFHPKVLLASLVLCLVMGSCSGQIDSKSSARQKLSSPPEQTAPVRPKDPMFFIEGQLCQHLRKTFQDSKGTLWFGTYVYDLMKYDGDSLQYIREEQGFSGGRVTGILEDDKGYLWVSSAQGLSRYDGTSFTTFTTKDGLRDHELWSLMRDSKGILWVGHNYGLSRFDGTTFTNFSVPKPELSETKTVFFADRITAIAEDADGSLWLGTDGYGICRFDGTSFTHLTTKDGLADNAISELMMDSKGQLWIGTFWGGLSKFDGKKITTFTTKDGISGSEVSALFEDDNGDIWFGVENNGVYKYDGESFLQFPQEQLSGASILNIYKDKENRFWFGGWGGLFRYDGNSFTPVTKDGPWQ
ncbi:MAG: two-component regulator propeller domain-containing protein [Bacteroidota bacterium]